MCGHRSCNQLATWYIERNIEGEIYCIPVCDSHKNMLQGDSIKPVSRVIKLLYIEYTENNSKKYIKANYDVSVNDAIEVSEGDL